MAAVRGGEEEHLDKNSGSEDTGMEINPREVAKGRTIDGTL